jgi:hypothetical protein
MISDEFDRSRTPAFNVAVPDNVKVGAMRKWRE